MKMYHKKHSCQATFLLDYSQPMREGKEDGLDEATELPIEGILDLHTFDPREVGDLLQHYFSLCREKGIFEVRVIHGKGSGVLRERVHSILRRLPEVSSFRLAGEDEGQWGATIVRLRPLDKTGCQAADL